MSITADAPPAWRGHAHDHRKEGPPHGVACLAGRAAIGTFGQPSQCHDPASVLGGWHAGQQLLAGHQPEMHAAVEQREPARPLGSERSIDDAATGRQ